MALDRDDFIALGVGAAVGGVIAGVLVYSKAQQLARRGDVLTRALEGRGSNVELVLAAMGRDTETSLGRIGQEEAERVAKATGENYLATEFGLTPARIAQISRLGSVF